MTIKQQSFNSLPVSEIPLKPRQLHIIQIEWDEWSRCYWCRIHKCYIKRSRLQEHIDKC